MGADEFGFHTVTLHLAGTGSGTVEQAPESARLEHGTAVTLTAIADPARPSPLERRCGRHRQSGKPDHGHGQGGDGHVRAGLFRVYLPLLRKHVP